MCCPLIAWQAHSTSRTKTVDRCCKPKKCRSKLTNGAFKLRYGLQTPLPNVDTLYQLQYPWLNNEPNAPQEVHALSLTSCHVPSPTYLPI